MANIVKDIRNLNNPDTGVDYVDPSVAGLEIAIPRAGQYKEERESNWWKSIINEGDKTNSSINKLHIIKILGIPAMEKNIPNSKGNGFFTPTTVSDLCKLSDSKSVAVQYDIEDFLYCKNIGLPINRLITLRRFPHACIDNIFSIKAQSEPDIARMVTYFTHDVNKLDDILGMSYNMKWKELQAEMDQMTMWGDQSGVSGFIKKVGTIFDPTLQRNAVSGAASGGPMSMYDPKFDQNRVYGPVDSIANTNIRDVGLEFTKEFEIVFDYELRSIGGRTPEYAFKDLIANVLACTFNNGKFWGGSRYWVGERPTNFRNKIAYLNSGDPEEIIRKGYNQIKSMIKTYFGDKGSALDTLKRALRGGFAIALGKILDSVGRPGIVAMQSLLSNEPTGNWHLTIGNPVNPILSIGNLIMTGTDIKFPTDSLSYGDFPTRIQFIVKLKPGMPKDRAGIEMIFNRGQQRIYYAPKKVPKKELKNNLKRYNRSFFNYSTDNINSMLREAYDFIEGKDANEVQQGPVTAFEQSPGTTYEVISRSGDENSAPSDKNQNTLENNNELKDNPFEDQWDLTPNEMKEKYPGWGEDGAFQKYKDQYIEYTQKEYNDRVQIYGSSSPISEYEKLTGQQITNYNVDDYVNWRNEKYGKHN